jgi:hypothetical protein
LTQGLGLFFGWIQFDLRDDLHCLAYSTFSRLETSRWSADFAVALPPRPERRGLRFS